MRRSLSVVLLILLAGTAAGQPVPPFPKTTPPAFQLVSDFDAGRGRVRFIHSELVPVQEKVVTKEIIDGRERVVERVVTKFVTVLKETEHKLAGFEILTGAGKTLTPDEAAPLVKDRLVLVVPDESGLDPAYLKVLAKDAIVFVRKKGNRE